MSDEKTTAGTNAMEVWDPAISPLAQAEGKAFEAEAAAALAQVMASVVVRDEPSYALAAETVKALRGGVERIETARKARSGPIDRLKKGIDAEYRPAREALEEAEKVLTERMEAYLKERREADARAIATAAAAPAGEATEAALATLQGTPQAAGAKAKVDWAGEVTDADKVPAMYKTRPVPDVPLLLEVTRTAGKDPGIPGWRAWPVDKVEVRRSPRKGKAKT